MRDALGNEVTGWMIAKAAVEGIARGALIIGLFLILPLYLWGDQIGAWARQVVAFFST